MQIRFKNMKNQSFYQFFSHLLDRQLLGTLFFGFLAISYEDIGCFARMDAVIGKKRSEIILSDFFAQLLIFSFIAVV